jgi:hypothetical protein
MKLIKTMLFATAITFSLLSCSKPGDDDGSDCEDNDTTKVTYTNTGTVPLRVQVATSLTSAFVPISPIVSIDLAPGASVVKEFAADKYFIVWYANCATTCTMYTYYAKTYATCGVTEEKHGF